ncbi:unnamed protein product [Anisakis simplex]|uniref:NIP3 homolog (inferred by orthology to a C. elegans protein) n=1 Tax=Anisakis simplex TaxID=6269 RepID=A0A0M3JQU1_ANISI|nr:unnamed protein product [Anisakis simplex]
MSFFDGRQPAMFDVKKRLGNVERSTIDEADSAPESWVELAPSRASLCSSVDALVMIDADITAREGSRQSPVSLQSPHVEFEPNLEQVKFRLTQDLPSSKNADWTWYWSSRPETHPPRSVRQRSGLLDSTLSTPPNSPEPESLTASSPVEYHRKAIISKSSSLFRLDILFGFVVSNLVTFMLGAAIGFCVCKKLVRSQKEI